MGSGASQMNIKAQQIQSQQDCTGEFADNHTEIKEGNSDCSLQKKELDSEGIIILDKQIQVLSKQNRKVQVIKMLKRLKQQDQNQMPELKQQYLANEKEELEQIKPKVQEYTNFGNQNAVENNQIREEVQKESKCLEAQNRNLQKIKKEQQQRPKNIENLQQTHIESTSQNNQNIFPQQTIKEQEQGLKTFSQFSPTLKSQTIQLSNNNSLSVQKSPYYQNQKIILTSPIKVKQAEATFKIECLKYCVGVGVALLEVMQKHSFNYKSYQNQLSHGLYIVTSQGYSWSHHLKQEDDQLHLGFHKVKNGDIIDILYQRGRVTFCLKDLHFNYRYHPTSKTNTHFVSVHTCTRKTIVYPYNLD